MMKLPIKDAINIVMELGIHSCIIIMGLAMSPDFFNNIEMGVSAGLYAVIMYIPTGLVAYLFLRLQRLKVERLK
jgi:hypothetical protein